MHIFEFVLNEYIDLEVDRLSPDWAEKPLVKGTVSLNAALGLVFGAMIISYILTIIFFFNFWTLLLLTLAFEFGAIYDIHGKRFAGSDFTLAFWIFFFCLFGASIVSIQFTGPLFLVAGLGFFQILFNNAIEGGLKDADHDAVGGAHTLAHALGVKVRSGKIILPGTFKFASYSIKLCYICLIILIIYFSKPPIIVLDSVWGYLQLFIIIIFIFIIFSTLHVFLNQVEFDRDKLKRIFSMHEISTYYIVPIILLQLLGLFSVLILLLIPLIWYILLNLTLYGKPLEPKV
jgi:4-hydroxybenzoate polyprenyltransferase